MVVTPAEALRRLLPTRTVRPEVAVPVPAIRSETRLAELDRTWPLAGADEHFRAIYTRAGLAPEGTIAITSAIAGEGKSSLALGLATTLALDFPRRRIALIETDLRHAVLAEDFQLPPSPGLAEFLAEEAPLERITRSTAIENLTLIPAGELVDNPARLLRSGRLGMAFEILRQKYDLLLLDLPAVLPDSTAVTIAELADASLFVVRAGATPRQVFERALAQLGRERVRGVILNGSHSAIPGWIRRLFGR